MRSWTTPSYTAVSLSHPTKLYAPLRCFAGTPTMCRRCRNEGRPSVHRLQVRRPALVDATDPPHDQRHHPRHDEEPDDPVPDVLEVDRRDGGERLRRDVELLDEDRHQLDDPDDEGHRDGERRDRDVVVD